MDALIRRATMDDAPAILAIYNFAVRETIATFDTTERTLERQIEWMEDHSNPRHPVLVAELGGQVVAWASLSRWADRCAYDESVEISVYVDPSAWGQGIARKLYAALLEMAPNLGVHTVLARVAMPNPASERLHDSFGFETVGIMREVGYKFGRRIDVAIYQWLVKQD